ncbi:cation diffusion facilitator family transporter [Geomonas sp. Red32]|uniref:cation diffusion facilitator family transporter n=1 Tax=Geomonas sp. Red32 TaxID=2912856 RepID=UPI00202CDC48|nr:cation diffusion facilitator family transporter [Geomonas sp. Red32]MCM0083924.1 cation diffusion facilitator family transporter [Geomonas sp. Red32]
MINAEHDLLKRKAARLSVISNSILVVLKLICGLASGSVSILSEAVHSAVDLVAAGIAWYSVRESGKPADDEHRFGHGKIENVAGTVEAVLIFAAGFYIIFEAVAKLRTGVAEVGQLGLGSAVMGGSALANYLVSRHLLSVAVTTDSVALEADAMHLRTDVYTSFGVFVGLIAIHFTGIGIIDPIIAIIVACMIFKAAWDLTKTAFFHILDVKLPDEEEAVIHEIMEGYGTQFIEYHKLRTRKSGHTRHIDMHLVVPRQISVEEGHALSDRIEADIEHRLPYSQILIHIEPCPGGCESCAAECPKVHEQMTKTGGK